MAVESLSLGPLFSLEIDNDCDVVLAKASEARVQAQLALLQRHVMTALRPSTMFHQRLIRDVRLMKQDICNEEGTDNVDVVVLATKLSSVGYRVHLRTALGAATTEGVECYYALRNEFLIVSGDGIAEGEDFIVEARFIPHFAIPQPTKRYAGLLEVIPEEVVATPAALATLVQLLCSEMSLAFEESGLSLPPWRHAKSLLSKWLPTRARDYDVSSCSMDSPRAGASPNAVSSMSALSSGMLTPMGIEGTSSPRAVLRSAAAALTPFNSNEYLQRRSSSSSARACSDSSKKGATTATTITSTKSLLSETLAGIKPPSKIKTTPESPTSAKKTEERGNEGWLTPIRRVRMQGASA